MRVTHAHVAGEAVCGLCGGRGDPERLLFAIFLNKGDTHTHVAGEAYCSLCGGGG